MTPFPEPFGVTVHHPASLITFHAEFETTVKEVEPFEAGTFWFGGVTDKVGAAAAWVTVTTTGVIPDTVTVIFATRPIIAVFSE